MPVEHILSQFHKTAPSYGGGMANHGPMAVEALEHLGLRESAPAFVARYLGRLEPLSEGSGVRPETLGQGSEAEWVAYFAEAIRVSSVEAVLATALPELWPGAMAGAAHGLLRTAHAARGFARQPGPVRAAEVAHGLGYWAAAFQTLPGVVGAAPSVGLTETLEALPGLHDDERSKAGFIFDRVRALDGVERFADAVAAVDLRSETLDSFIATASGAAARMMLTSSGAGFAYLHVVTASVALRVLAGFVDAAQHPELMRAGFHCAAALHAAHGGAKDWLRWEPPSVLPDVGSLAARAAATGEEHAIKLTGAVLEQYALSPDPALLCAAEAEIQRVA